MAAKTEKARPGCNQGTRRAVTGNASLPQAAKEGIFALAALALCLAIVWGMSAMYQKGYAAGYEEARTVQHG